MMISYFGCFIPLFSFNIYSGQQDGEGKSSNPDSPSGDDKPRRRPRRPKRRSNRTSEGTLFNVAANNVWSINLWECHQCVRDIVYVITVN